MRGSLRRGSWVLLLITMSVSGVVCSSGGGGGGGGNGNGNGGAGSADFPLRFAGDGRRLEDAGGRPFLMLGDSAWSLMVLLTQAQVEAYLDDRRGKGFNTVLVNLIERGFGGPENTDGDAPFASEDDFSVRNEAYFAHADRVIDAAAERDMLVLLTPAYLGIRCGDQGWCTQMLAQTTADMLDYGRYLGSRYASKTNILWVHGGDANAGNLGALSHVNAIAQGIGERASSHLHTAHCSRQNSGIDCYDEPWLDINTTYSNCGGTLDRVRDDWERAPAFPFFYIEGSYENDGGVDVGCLIDQAAWSIAGGGAGHVFGNDPIWRFGSGWEAELGSDGSVAMRHVARLFRSRAWHRLVPDFDGDLLAAGAGDGALSARTSDGQSILVYVPSGRNLAVDLAPLAGSQAHGWWFDPTDGSSNDLGVFASAGIESFVAPGRGFLVIDDDAANLPRPGS